MKTIKKIMIAILRVIFVTMICGLIALVLKGLYNLLFKK